MTAASVNSHGESPLYKQRGDSFFLFRFLSPVYMMKFDLLNDHEVLKKLIRTGEARQK